MSGTTYGGPDTGFDHRYPKDFTFVCPTEIIAFSDRAKEFEALNCQVGMRWGHPEGWLVGYFNRATVALASCRIVVCEPERAEWYY